MKRTVLAAQVNADSYDEFVKALLNSSITIRLGAKVVEISHTDEDRDLIKGIFVSTQKADLPPQHAPGDDDDYSAIPIDIVVVVPPFAAVATVKYTSSVVSCRRVKRRCREPCRNIVFT